MKGFLKDKRPLATIGLAFLGAAITHWYIPHEQVSMMAKSFIITWVVIAFVTGALGVMLMKRAVRESSLLVTTGFVLAVFLRVIFEILKDPTSHNLWPFEILITILIALPASMLGAFLISSIGNKDK